MVKNYRNISINAGFGLYPTHFITTPLNVITENEIARLIFNIPDQYGLTSGYNKRIDIEFTSASEVFAVESYEIPYSSEIGYYFDINERFTAKEFIRIQLRAIYSDGQEVVDPVILKLRFKPAIGPGDPANFPIPTPDDLTIMINNAIEAHYSIHTTSETYGHVKVDGDTIITSASGVISTIPYQPEVTKEIIIDGLIQGEELAGMGSSIHVNDDNTIDMILDTTGYGFPLRVISTKNLNNEMTIPLDTYWAIDDPLNYYGYQGYNSIGYLNYNALNTESILTSVFSNKQIIDTGTDIKLGIGFTRHTVNGGPFTEDPFSVYGVDCYELLYTDDIYWDPSNFVDVTSKIGNKVFSNIPMSYYEDTLQDGSIASTKRFLTIPEDTLTRIRNGEVVGFIFRASYTMEEAQTIGLMNKYIFIIGQFNLYEHSLELGLPVNGIYYTSGSFSITVNSRFDGSLSYPRNAYRTSICRKNEDIIGIMISNPSDSFYIDGFAENDVYMFKSTEDDFIFKKIHRFLANGSYAETFLINYNDYFLFFLSR